MVHVLFVFMVWYKFLCNQSVYAVICLFSIFVQCYAVIIWVFTCESRFQNTSGGSVSNTPDIGCLIINVAINTPPCSVYSLCVPPYLSLYKYKPAVYIYKHFLLLIYFPIQQFVVLIVLPLTTIQSLILNNLILIM